MAREPAQRGWSSRHVATLQRHVLTSIGSPAIMLNMTNPSQDRALRGRKQDARLAANNVDDRCLVNVVHLRAVQAARRVLPAPELTAHVADRLALLANATRLRILLALRPRGTHRPELCVCDLAVVCGASQSMISHQLRLLRTAGLITQRRDGKLAYYRLRGRATASVLRSVLALAPGPEVPD